MNTQSPAPTKKTRFLLLSIIAGTLLGGAMIGSANAALILADFEAASGYTAGDLTTGQDGWTSVANSRITPDPSNSGYKFALAGAQSAYATGDSSNGAKKQFSFEGATASDMWELSWLQGNPDAMPDTKFTGLNVIDSLGASVLGIYAKNTTGSTTTTDSTIRVLGKNGEVNTAVKYGSGGGGTPTINTVYRFTLQFDWNNFRASAYYEDVTNAPGTRNFLTTVDFDSTLLPSAASAAANAGIVMYGSGATGAFDNIQLEAIPEPGTATLLLGSGIACFLLFKRKRA